MIWLLQVVVIFYRRKEGKQILLKLKANKVLRSQEAHFLWAVRIGFIPGIVDCLGEEVDPSPVGCRKTKRGTKRRRENYDRGFVELAVIREITSGGGLDVTFTSISLYLSLFCSNRELVEPTIYDFVPLSARTSNC